MKKQRSLEQKARSRARRGAIESAILQTISVAGILTVAAMAPNAVRVIKHIDPDWVAPPNPRQRLREALSRMKRKGLVKFVERDGRYLPALTAKGKQEAVKIRVGLARIPKPLRWDGRWRVVVFDIPEKRRHLRDTVRGLVRNLGFVRLQDSVWAHPYDCEELIKLIKTDLRIGAEVLYMIADVEYDRPLREAFGLPLEK